MEIELKYSLNKTQKSTFKTATFLQNLREEKKTLISTYYDDRKLSLLGHDYILRIRKSGTDYVQTVKKSGKVDGALHSRPEWEWLISHDKPEPQFFPEPSLVESIHLIPIFITEFERTTWQIVYENTKIELCLDDGLVYLPEHAIFSQKSSEPILEIEMELISGKKEDLLAFGTQIEQRFALSPETKSKAQRGFELYASILRSH